MAAYIADGYNDGGVLVLEAGTGVGKSFAYLVPALAWARANGERTVVSTNTINLQEQLVGKDLPDPARGAGATEDWAPTFALLKGWRNYLCLSRLQQAIGAQQSLLEPEQAGRAGVARRVGRRARRTGRSATWPSQPSREVWDEVSAEADLCTRVQCAHFDRASCSGAAPGGGGRRGGGQPSPARGRPRRAAGLGQLGGGGGAAALPAADPRRGAPSRGRRGRRTSARRSRAAACSGCSAGSSGTDADWSRRWSWSCRAATTCSARASLDLRARAAAAGHRRRAARRGAAVPRACTACSEAEARRAAPPGRRVREGRPVWEEGLRLELEAALSRVRPDAARPGRDDRRTGWQQVESTERGGAAAAGDCGRSSAGSRASPTGSTARCGPRRAASRRCAGSSVRAAKRQRRAARPRCRSTWRRCCASCCSRRLKTVVLTSATLAAGGDFDFLERRLGLAMAPSPGDDARDLLLAVRLSLASACSAFPTTSPTRARTRRRTTPRWRQAVTDLAYAVRRRHVRPVHQPRGARDARRSSFGRCSTRAGRCWCRGRAAARPAAAALPRGRQRHPARHRLVLGRRGRARAARSAPSCSASYLSRCPVGADHGGAPRAAGGAGARTASWATCCRTRRSSSSRASGA